MDVALEQLPEDRAFLKALIAPLLESGHSLQRQNEQLGHRLQQLLRGRFGPQAEKLDAAQSLLLAQQILAEVQPAEPAEEAEEAPAARPGHGRRKLPRNLPRRRVVLDLPPAERVCRCCGTELTRIGEETSEQID
jgi:hypothetical protein